MNRNRMWISLLFVVGLSVFIFSAKTFFEIYQFISLTDSIPAFEIHPNIVKPKRRGGYRLAIDYSYEVEGKVYRKSQPLEKSRYYKNRWAAQEAYLEILKTPHMVSFKKSYPTHSQLDKSFPFKRVFSCAILVGILVYFFLLGRYIFTLE